VGALGRRALDAARWLATEPPAVGRVSGETVFLAAAVLAQWASVAALAASVPHNGWLYYQGGDQSFFYTIAWIVSQGHLPVTGIGYVWSLVEAPVALASGPSYLRGLPAIVAVQVLVLLPLALVAFYGTAKRLLGSAPARLGVVAWVAAPFAVIPLFVDRYHVRWVDQSLPQLLGLTGMGDFASMVVLLCAAYLVFRHLDTGDWETAALAGLVAGLALGLKPSTSIFLAGPAAAFLVSRRWRGALAFGVALVPAVATLALWKYRGLGTLPIFESKGETVLAAGARATAGYVAAGSGIHRYVDVDWHHLGQNLDAIREYFWSNRVVEFVPLAGALGALRVSRPKGALLIGWLAAYVLVKGTSDVASVDSASFWRLLSPAWPAYLLLGLSLAALAPTLGARLGAAAVHPPATRRRRLAVGAALLGIVPLVVVAALPRDAPAVNAVYDRGRNLYVPVDTSFALRPAVSGAAVTLAWAPPRTGGVRPGYFVLRAPATGTAHDGVDCDGAPVPRCTLSMDDLGYQSPPFVDHPGPGNWVYRVAQTANYTATPGEGDPVVFSKPSYVTVSAS
jgi:hypothetical protein